MENIILPLKIIAHLTQHCRGIRRENSPLLIPKTYGDLPEIVDAYLNEEIEEAERDFEGVHPSTLKPLPRFLTPLQPVPQIQSATVTNLGMRHKLLFYEFEEAPINPRHYLAHYFFLQAPRQRFFPHKISRWHLELAAGVPIIKETMSDYEMGRAEYLRDLSQGVKFLQPYSPPIIKISRTPPPISPPSKSSPRFSCPYSAATALAQLVAAGRGRRWSTAQYASPEAHSSRSSYHSP